MLHRITHFSCKWIHFMSIVAIFEKELSVISFKLILVFYLDDLVFFFCYKKENIKYYLNNINYILQINIILKI